MNKQSKKNTFPSTEARNQKIVEYALSGEYSLQEIAELTGVSGQTVNNVCLQRGFRPREVRKAHYIEKVLSHFKGGGTWGTISDSLGKDTSYWQYFANNNGIYETCSDLNKLNKQKAFDSRVDDVIAFIKQGHTREEAAREFGVSLNSVFTWLRGKDVPSAVKLNTDELELRNKEIVARYGLGESVKSLAESFSLSTDCIYKIIRS